MKYIKPPLDGIISLKIFKEPISLQTKGNKRKELKKIILESLEKIEFCIASDVAVEIIWIINEWERIKSSSTPDVDNIIKPILDAISGIDGILIDDSQIKEVNCKWEHSDFVDVYLMIKIKMLGKAYFKRNDIFFLEYDDKICIPFDRSNKKANNITLANFYQEMLTNYSHFKTNNRTHNQSKFFLPPFKLYHRSKISQNFENIRYSEYIES
jgi:Holliday junction resolvase RusA-like endonuclease